MGLDPLFFRLKEKKAAIKMKKRLLRGVQKQTNRRKDLLSYLQRKNDIIIVFL